MIFKELTKIVADNNLIERSKETFWEVLKACLLYTSDAADD